MQKQKTKSIFLSVILESISLTILTINIIAFLIFSFVFIAEGNAQSTVTEDLTIEDGSQLINLRVHVSATPPSPAYTGMLYHDTDDNKIYRYDGSAWREMFTRNSDGTYTFSGHVSIAGQASASAIIISGTATVGTSITSPIYTSTGTTTGGGFVDGTFQVYESTTNTGRTPDSFVVDGALMVGTTSTDAKAHVNAASDATATVILELQRTANGYTPTNRMLDLAFSDTPNKAFTAGISAIRKDALNNFYSEMAFYVNTLGSNGTNFHTALTEAIRIDNTAKVIINSATTSAAYQLVVGGYVRGTGFVSDSNVETKKNVAALTAEKSQSLLDAYAQMEVSEWDWKPQMRIGGRVFDTTPTLAMFPDIRNATGEVELSARQQLDVFYPLWVEEMARGRYKQKQQGLVVGNGRARPAALEAIVEKNPRTGFEEGIDLSAAVQQLIALNAEMARQINELKKVRVPQSEQKNQAQDAEIADLKNKIP